jgi:hypothetical protein
MMTFMVYPTPWPLSQSHCMTDAPQTVKPFVTGAPLGQTGTMTTFRPALTGFFLLAACAGPLSIYYRPGVSVSRMQTDQIRCEVSALRDAPVATEIRQRAPIFFPGRQICDASGACFSEPGYWAEGGFYSVDPNRDLRARLETMCMANKGYQPVAIPPCPDSVARAVKPSQTQTLPKLNEGSCSIRNDDGSWQIVTRG